ncbi:hypothetical protein SNEBB_006377 [Seison nebaliae]|nr:hypothetical protein SNEBB_006377 [Seison nebaliae]
MEDESIKTRLEPYLWNKTICVAAYLNPLLGIRYYEEKIRSKIRQNIESILLEICEMYNIEILNEEEIIEETNELNNDLPTYRKMVKNMIPTIQKAKNLYLI